MSTPKYLLAAAVATACAMSNAQFGGKGFESKGGGRGAEAPASRSDNAASAGPLRLDQVVQKLYDLRMRLLITADEAAKWDDFSNKYIRFTMPQPVRASDYADQTAAQSVLRRLETAQLRYVLTEDFYEATKVLYEALTPAQRKVADEWLPRLLLDATAPKA